MLCELDVGMNDVVISVNGLGKRYRLGERERYGRLRDAIDSVVLAPARLIGVAGKRRKPPAETLWALKDASFEVKAGEVVGIIGGNGAGKSTLLKILSRITLPTEGWAKIYGRVGSLLEVGTGFHLELTGRENVYLSGSILGMKRQEMTRKFDEIVAFAEVDQFLDTPVKHYSSGMQVRLGFAVAVHLEPEILIVDEVLAVGDAAFQRKCMDKVSEVAKKGLAVLLVSHNMDSVQRLCTTAYLLEHGRIIMAGAVTDVVACYSRTYLSSVVDIST